MVSTRAFRTAPTDTTTHVPRSFGRRGAVASESTLATQAGADVMKDGGNAVDAAVAATFVETVTNPQMGTLGGECPALIRMAGASGVAALNGNMAAPGSATAEAYKALGHSEVPESGILAAGVPATLGALVTALMRFGRRPLEAVVAPARDLCRDGFPAHAGLVRQEKFGLAAIADGVRNTWPGTAAVYLPDGRVPEVGELLTNPPLARTLDHLVAAERRAGGSRDAGLQAVLDAFYRGEVAAEIDSFSREREGFLAKRDLEIFETREETPLHLDFGGTRIHKCGFWNQGPVFLQALAILKRFDLAGMGHNSADYLHYLVEAMKLAFADREQYYGDPDHTDVPDGLLADAYTAARTGLLDPARADDELRPGDPANAGAELPVAERLGGVAWGPGTMHIDAVDAEGNMAAFTPSGGWLKSNEVIPELGFPLGNRMMTFYLDPPHHPNILAPHKRPRTTISPSLAERGGEPWTVFGTMGGDQQDQWQLQYFLNRVVFDMPPQAAIEAPKVSSEHFPGFFAPHTRFPQRVRIEPRIGEDVRRDLAARGHELDVAADWTEGYLCAIERHESGVLETGHDPRGPKGEVFAPLSLAW